MDQNKSMDTPPDLSVSSLPEIQKALQKSKETFEALQKIIAGEIGSEQPLSKPDVEMLLYPTRKSIVAGEQWSLLGEIRNRSDSPIWIADYCTWIIPPPEIQGLGKAGSSPAFFPTIRGRETDEVIRIEAHSAYTVVFRLGPKFQTDSWFANIEAIKFALRDFLFFYPGTFTVSATTHIWPVPPTIGEEGQVTNTGQSFTINCQCNILADASPWVLIFASSLGGLLSFALQILSGAIPLGSTTVLAIRTFLVGTSTTVLLCGVVTILLSRLAKVDFIISLKINDFWGAIASGFAIQWIGQRVIETLLPRL